MKKTTERQTVTTSALLKPLLVLMLTTASFTVNAQQKVIQLFAGAAPGSESWNWDEKETTKNLFNTHIVYNVTQPTITAFLPDAAVANGTAVLVCPGGGYQILMMESEGVNVARWLNQKGIAAFILKYRTKHLSTNDPFAEHFANMMQKNFIKDIAPILKLQLQDAQAAISHIRVHAAEYSVKPERIGIIGFSAGGTLSANLAYNYTPETRPSFAAPIYAPIELIEQSGVPKDAPPLFIVAASDDGLVPATQSSHLYTEWLKAKRPVELHVFSKGGHGFGLKKQNLPVDTWTELFVSWLNTHGMLEQKKQP